MTILEARDLIAYALAPDYSKSSDYSKKIFLRQAEALLAKERTLPEQYPLKTFWYIMDLVEKWQFLSIKDFKKK